MAQELTVGRAGLDVDIEIVQMWDQSGNEVRLEGKVRPASNNELKVVRQQLQGLVDSSDEPVVPVTFATDPTLDGFYRIGDLSTRQEAGWFNSTFRQATFEVTLRRVSSYSSPTVESKLVGALRVNAHSITSADTQPGIWLPASANGVALTSGTTAVTLGGGSNRTTADGDAMTWWHDDAQAMYDDVLEWWVPPADWFDGSASVQHLLGGTWWPAVGRQVPLDTEAWRLSNGLVRVSQNATDPSHLDVHWWDGTAWRTKTWRFQVLTSGVAADDFPAPHTVRVLHNTPSSAAVRLTFDGPVNNANNSKQTDLDLRVRRGGRIVYCHLSTTYMLGGANPEVFRVRRATTDAAASVTGGMSDAAADADGHTWLCLAPDAHFVNTTEGMITDDDTAGDNTQFPFGLALEVDSASAVNPDTLAYLSDMYFAAVSDSVRVVAP